MDIKSFLSYMALSCVLISGISYASHTGKLFEGDEKTKNLSLVSIKSPSLEEKTKGLSLTMVLESTVAEEERIRRLGKYITIMRPPGDYSNWFGLWVNFIMPSPEAHGVFVSHVEQYLHVITDTFGSVIPEHCTLEDAKRLGN